MQRRKIKLTKFSKDAERRAFPQRQLCLFSRLVLCTTTALLAATKNNCSAAIVQRSCCVFCGCARVHVEYPDPPDTAGLLDSFEFESIHDSRERRGCSDELVHAQLPVVVGVQLTHNGRGVHPCLILVARVTGTCAAVDRLHTRTHAHMVPVINLLIRTVSAKFHITVTALHTYILRPAVLERCEVLKSACMSVCLSARISLKPHLQTSRNFLQMLYVAVA